MIIAFSHFQLLLLWLLSIVTITTAIIVDGKSKGGT
jgi:hypothetical protein